MENNYYELYTFWITNIDKMFIENEEYDKLIKDKYESLLLKELEWYNEKTQKEINDNVIIISKIILCDQISRHVYRHSKKEIKKYDEIALLLFDTNHLLTKIDTFLPIERLLLLMPYRHTFKYHKIQICLTHVKKWLKETENKDEIQLYERFIKASLKTILKKHNDPTLLNIEYFKHSEISIKKDIYDTHSIKYTNKIKEINTEHKYVKQFFDSMNEININNKKLVVSLSAGIDSNVLLFLLYSYIKKYQIPCELRCLIMYYKNRLNQYEEIKIAQNLCSQLKIDLYIRNVEEVQRETLSDRSYYEDYTKEVKYKCYEKLGECIFLGHHKDDLFENIINNIRKKNNYNNLNGMEKLQEYDKIKIIRPMLNLTKDMITELAHEFNIPYVYDSTPRSSERGLVRDRLMPLIKQFDNRLYDGFFDLTQNFYEIYKIYEGIFPKIEIINNKVHIENKNIYFYDYWKKVFIQVTQYYQLECIKNKSIYHFINMMKKIIKEDKNYFKCHLSQYLLIEYKKDYFECSYHHSSK